jgi:hypothetical protein
LIIYFSKIKEKYKRNWTIRVLALVRWARLYRKGRIASCYAAYLSLPAALIEPAAAARLMIMH